MPPTDNHGSFLNRISMRRNQVISVDVNHDQEVEELELFQKHVSDRFIQLLPPQSPQLPATGEEETHAGDTLEPLLSIAWFRKLLDVYLCCESEFKAVLIIGRDATHFSKPPLDRLLPDYLDRTVKALDICNAITHGIELVRHWQRLAQIAVDALEQRPIVEGHVRRAKRALNTLLTSMTAEDKEQNVHAGKSAERMWSIGRRGGAGSVPPTVNHNRRLSVSRSLSSSFTKSWSASKQIQAMTANLVAPRGGDPTGLSLPVYIMSSTLVFVMWTLVAAVPCPERVGPVTHFQLPRNMVWTHPMIGLQEKIGEEWKKKEKKGTAGLLAEIQVIEKVAQNLVDFAEGFEFPVSVEKGDEVAAHVTELSEICRKLEVGLGPLQLQVREVFRRMVRSRAEVLDVMDVVGKINTHVPY